jgi:hypothetical protein
MAPAHHKACDIFVPIIALIVALCLLAVSALQLLRRRFYMAGGYRRCWPSLCRWAPFLDDLRDFNGVARANDELLLSPNYSSNVIEVKGAPMPSFSPTVATVDQRASWPLLLERLRQHESCSLPVPTLALRKNPTKSTSSEVVKPVVVTALPTVAVLARRLGMIWSEFRPERGVLHAEGNRQMLTTRMTPSTSTSIVLRYSVERNDGVTAETCTKNEFYVPVSEADAMGFGILRGCRSLGMPDFCIGTIEEVLDTMDALDPSGRATKTLRDVRRLEPNVTFGFSDLLPLAAPVMRLRGSTIIRLPIPTEYCVGLTCHREGFVIFRHRLGNYKARLLADASGKDMHSEDQQGKVDGRAGAYSPSGSGGAAGEGARQNLNRWHYSSIHSRSQTDWVLAQYDRLRQGWSYWEDEVEANRLMNGRDLAFLEQVHDCWDATTEYFQHLEQRHAGFRYRDLVASHVRHAVHYWADAWARMRNEGECDHSDPNSAYDND